TPEDLESLGCPGRSQHVFSQLQRQWQWIEEHPFLSKEVRCWLEDHTDLSLPILSHALHSEDDSTKCILSLNDGELIEVVHMPREVKTSRVTLCISSQVGCAMGCTFCATGAMGIKRNLESGEIVGQVLLLMKTLGPKTPDHLTLVFMGMGEPLH
ncbi:MAG: 23S rRNA (adenine(2503)-C(2))-methyltransferase RlmN, partial [Holophagaceae bacterium]